MGEKHIWARKARLNFHSMTDNKEGGTFTGSSFAALQEPLNYLNPNSRIQSVSKPATSKRGSSQFHLVDLGSVAATSTGQMSKVCAIFGGSRGIGQAVAQLLARKGYCLAVIARNLDRAQATVDRLGAGHLALSCDITKEEAIQKTFKEIENKLGHIRYLVNAAGINRDGLLLRTKSEDMISQLQTNLLGTMLTCKAAVKSMIQQQGGAIVNVGSIVGLKGNAGQSAYSASKAGLVGFSRSFAKEVARKNIQVNMVAPGFIHTDMTAHLKEEELKKTIPLGRFGQPQEVAQSIAFLLESPYVTGLVLVVDGGLQLLI